MKLAEALTHRADIQRRLAQLKQRISVSARHQEGEAPPEDPGALLQEGNRLLDSLQWLIGRINRTNLSVELSPGVSLTDALAERDVLGARRGFLSDAANAASVRQDRYSRSEVRFVTPLDIAQLHRDADDVARRFRELDALIQAKNWEADLIE